MGEQDELKELVKEFFVNYLDVVEESDSGKEFHPIYIGCPRALKTEGLNNLLERMRDIAVGEEEPKELDDAVSKFFSEQKPLEPEFQKVLYDNLWDLYSKSEDDKQLDMWEVFGVG